MPIVKLPFGNNILRKTARKFVPVNRIMPGEDDYFECSFEGALDAEVFLDNDDLSYAGVIRINGQKHVYGATYEGSHGGIFTFPGGDRVSFTPNGDFDSLVFPDVLTTSVEYEASDEQTIKRAKIFVDVYAIQYIAPQTVPDLGATTTSALTSGNVLTNDIVGSKGLMYVSRVNGLAENLMLPVQGSNSGTFTLDSSGDWTFDPADGFEGLEESQSTETFITYHLSDDVTEVEGLLTITVTQPAQGIPFDLFRPVAAKRSSTIGVKADGTVISAGWNYYGMLNLTGWENVVVVATGLYHTVGLRADGTCVATGENDDGQCNVSSWTGIKAIACGQYHTLGLKEDGTVLAIGYNNRGQTNTSTWADVIDISANEHRSIGVTSAGVLLFTGDQPAWFVNRDFTGVTRLSLGVFHAVGLRPNGTCVGSGYNDVGQLNVTEWNDIIYIACGQDSTYGVRENGTVLALGNDSNGQQNVSGWTDIVAVAAGDFHVVGIKSDGTAVGAGWNSDDQIEVSGWNGLRIV